MGVPVVWVCRCVGVPVVPVRGGAGGAGGHGMVYISGGQLKAERRQGM